MDDRHNLQCLYFRYVGVFLPHLIIFSQRLKLRLRPRFRDCDCDRDFDILSTTAIKRLRLHMQLPLHIFADILSNVRDIQTAIATTISTVLRPQFSHCVCDRDSAIAIAASHCNRDFINCERHWNCDFDRDCDRVCDRDCDRNCERDFDRDFCAIATAIVYQPTSLPK